MLLIIVINQVLMFITPSFSKFIQHVCSCLILFQEDGYKVHWVDCPRLLFLILSCSCSGYKVHWVHCPRLPLQNKSFGSLLAHSNTFLEQLLFLPLHLLEVGAKSIGLIALGSHSRCDLLSA